ncbi:MAG: DUF3127 domain-containing protein [Bacteroidaceae bacterium]|nr:DUF3127 domain-containing protein [Bacteroidaceae bacterium]
MEITGKIIAVLEPRKGTSSRTGSEWVCGQYVLETMDQYPRKLFFEVFGSDRMQQFNIQLGEVMTVSFDIDAREYQGRWYNGVRAFRVDRNVQAAPIAAAPVAPDTTPFGGAPVPTQAPAPASTETPTSAPFAPQAEGEDLPF